MIVKLSFVDLDQHEHVIIHYRFDNENEFRAMMKRAKNPAHRIVLLDAIKKALGIEHESD